MLYAEPGARLIRGGSLSQHVTARLFIHVLLAWLKVSKRPVYTKVNARGLVREKSVEQLPCFLCFVSLL